MSRTVAPVGISLAVLSLGWVILPRLDSIGVFPAMLLSAIGYPMEIILGLFLILGMAEGYRRSLWISAAAILILAGFLEIAVSTSELILPIVAKGILPPLLVGGLVSRGWKAGRSLAVALAVSGIIMMPQYLEISQIMNDNSDQMMESFRVDTSTDASKSDATNLSDEVDSLAVTGTTTSADDQTTSGGGAAWLRSLGYNSKMIEEMQDAMAWALFWSLRLLPTMLLMSGWAQLIMAFLLVEWFYRRRDSYFPGLGPFIYWKAPDQLIYFLGVALMMRMTMDGSGQVVADNLLFALSIFYCICGLAFLEHLLRKIKLPILFKILFYFGLFLMQLPGMMMAAVVGLFDSYFDWRKIRAHSLG